MKETKLIRPPELMAILVIRLTVLLGLACVSLLMPNDDAAFYAFLGVAMTLSVPYSLALRKKLQHLQFAPLQFLVDLTLVTGLVYFTGGLQSNLTLLYPLIILSAGIVGTRKQAVQMTGAAIALYAIMVTLLSRQLTTESLPGIATHSAGIGYIALALRSVIFGFFGALSIYISNRCNLVRKKDHTLFNTAHALIYKSPCPTLLLNPDDTILMANAAACEQLNQTEAELCCLDFPELIVEDESPIPESYGQAHHLRREGHDPLPVSVKTASLQLPDGALALAADDKHNLQTYTFLIFTDLSRPLELDRQLERVERITQATRLAGEMAHEIRTPLTSISASVQLLKHYEERATSADWLPNSPRRRDREEIFAHIGDASHQLDSVIQNFLDFAEFSSEDLLSIIKLDSIEENQGYIGHLNTIGRGLTNGQNSDSGRRSNNSQFIE